MLYISLRQYEYILAVADAGSLTAAAHILNVSQPSLSTAITRVEEILGQPLFIRRKGASIQLTPFGHRFVAKARDLLTHARDIETPQGPAPFTLACFQDIAPWYLASALSDLSAQFPDHQFQGREGSFADLQSDLAEGRADVVLSYDLGFAGTLQRRTLTTVNPTAFLAQGHPLATRSCLSMTDLSQHPLILFDDDLSQGFVRDILQKQGISHSVAHKVRSLEMMRSFAAHGAGIGISYSCPPTAHSYDGAPVIQIPISAPEASADIKLIWPTPTQRNTDIQHTIDFLATWSPMA